MDYLRPVGGVGRLDPLAAFGALSVMELERAAALDAVKETAIKTFARHRNRHALIKIEFRLG